MPVLSYSSDRGASILAQASVALIFLASPASAQVQHEVTLEGSFAGTPINESSGVAVSRSHPGVLWTHNDSGSDPLIFAMLHSGELIAVFDVTGAEAEDWEDIALGPCPEISGDCLYIADTGNNRLRRRRVSLYIIPEPDPNAGSPDSTVRTARAQLVEFRYGDRGSYDVEAMAVSPEGNVSLVTKGRTGSILHFVLEKSEFAENPAEARLIGQLPILPVRNLGRWVTGAAISPSGERVVVRTLTELFFFAREGENWSLDSPSCWLGTLEPQGEAVDFLDERTVIITSESVLTRPGTIHRISCHPG